MRERSERTCEGTSAPCLRGTNHSVIEGIEIMDVVYAG